ncbi:hypothetical protein [Arthrobacter sp. efr-133-TYG-120]|uniref:hypothetical protein n=1 Tax=Arthrobacter sp. efr-133-TYG-120 TaxID=3040280 RepID=UPI00254B9223|nr:hypothetical protein [Arthrobacter sp. efr-133-TYG-120]
MRAIAKQNNRLGALVRIHAERCPFSKPVAAVSASWETAKPVSPAVQHSLGKLKVELLNRGLLPFLSDNRVNVRPAVMTPEEVRQALAIS